MNISFYGAAGETTGSNYLLEEEGTKILIDCGLFQGGHFAEEKNYQAFEYNPEEIDALIVTHAHLDHIGRIPLLVKQGFKGKIFATAPTKDLALLFLKDSCELFKEEADRDRHQPLCVVSDVPEVERLFRTVEYGEKFSVGAFSVQLTNAGHILGSAVVEVRKGSQTIIFSGDLGSPFSPLLLPPAFISAADYVIMESVYGDRLHKKDSDRGELLEDIVEDTVKRGGVLMIPAFAMERTQDILYNLDTLVTEGRIPRVPVFVDSPLAQQATAIYKKYPAYYHPAIQEEIRKEQSLFSFPGLVFTGSVQESKHINEVSAPKIIIAGSGMSQGGRILHHERRYLQDEKSTILMIGYQTKGSRGRAIQDGASSVEIFGETVPVRCRVARIDGYSAHADQKALAAWARPFKDVVKQVFLVHGEEEASRALSFELKDLLGIDVVIPKRGESFFLT